MHTSFRNKETDLQGRFRYWLLGDLILCGSSDHAGHRIFAARHHEML